MGWMVLTGATWCRDSLTNKEILESKEREDDMLASCQESLLNLEPGMEDCLGEVLSLQSKTLSWDRLVTKTASSSQYQVLLNTVEGNKED